MEQQPDIVIIGSGIGGSTVAAGLAGSGARIAILERGERLPDTPEARSYSSIFVKGHFRPKEMWREADGTEFNPGNFYFVGGNSKLFGAVLLRYRAEDFTEMQHLGGVSPAWPFLYEELEPWYGKAEQLFEVRGELGQDPTEPFHASPYPYGPVPDEPAIARARAELKAQGLNPATLPLGVDIETWLAGGRTPWDGFPNTGKGKKDAETASLASALNDPNIELITSAHVDTLEKGRGGRIEAVHYTHRGEKKRLSPKLVILSAGAINSAAILLRSGDGKGLANASGQVGRNFMNHNCSAMLAINPFRRNDSIYQKTLMLNDYYLTGGRDGLPLGNVQLLGKINGDILKANAPVWAPRFALDFMAGHAVDWYMMTEDLPNPESRIMVDGKGIIMQWRRSNMEALSGLEAKMRAHFKAAGYPIVLSQAFDKRTPSHQCGTIRMGTDPGQAPLDVYCRAFDHPNLFVVDAGFLPTSAAVNPALTVAAQALRVADHIVAKELRA
ncbi:MULTISPECIES: GMC family oxidoreductase [Ensifer]|jgi:choline dehydrogenase-like flavoprotein|uniref:FAD-dependent oxidoreductase n=1 Tax=Ensifer canadensis TaxID=555315 RepID=A0AAW4FQH8_9HYPH|nr:MULTISPECIES: GMC family oxidoreductase [Ensifer]AHK42802.1 putative dehydrogenase transmembrane protein [Ensifer adhaerens OV14]MDP9632787.1 choline dehydrogenase-like flavoprotein [Ensifer adhaerens]KQU77502.1 GMC family oxidoreductase [Ensifer sp. Root31]KQW48217.1 GMC family oxidoreductase [Ensifer sp. Root1252]KQW65876.1 GMC family oxidoreductase [Ensifer sp. Root127]